MYNFKHECMNRTRSVFFLSRYNPFMKKHRCLTHLMPISGHMHMRFAFEDAMMHNAICPAAGDLPINSGAYRSGTKYTNGA
jgi:hypothetical protein